ncbi:MAG: FtsW/RodA/SpoVE family cell cycle protein [Bacilli bacterium]|nr:FtsW/RodA/SpoVE family cell cycle protein [Bacilli bacterium]
MRSKFKNMDKFLFFLMIIYTILGLVMVFSASSMTAVLEYGQSESFFFVRQLVFVILAYIAGFIILFIPNSIINLLKKMNKLIIFGAIGLLLITLLFGKTINGAKSWIDLGVISIQPSEFVKTMTILFIAFSFNNPKKMFTKFKFLTPFIYAVICVALIAFQPDFGTAMILAITCFFMFVSLPLKDSNYKKLKIIAGAFAVICCCMFFFGGEILKNTKILSEKQLSRLTFTNPCTRYREPTGYQVCNGFIAINNGGLLGSGLGNSTQKFLYLPEAFTDFIFPIIVEELGSIAGAFIIIGFLIMLYRILKIARNAETLTGSLLAFGTFSLIVTHLLINLLGVLAIIPITGVPLPFLSSGGSFLLNIIILLFITERVSIESKNTKLKREIANL